MPKKITSPSAVTSSSPPSGLLNRRDTLALLSAPLLLLIGDSVLAQTSGLQSYDVELVVFRNLGGASSEDWGSQANPSGQGLIPDTGEAAEALAEATPLTAPSATFPPLPASKFKLTSIADTLRRSKRYQPVAHFGWSQPGYARGEAKFAPVDSLIGSTNSGLGGRIALARGRYLHLTLDITVTGDDGQRYQLQQTRRMRSNERHYIDHPKFGVIALIAPSAG